MMVSQLLFKLTSLNFPLTAQLQQLYKLIIAIFKAKLKFVAANVSLTISSSASSTCRKVVNSENKGAH